MATRTKKLTLYCPPDRKQDLTRIKLYYAAKRVLRVTKFDDFRGIVVANLEYIPRKKKT